MLEVLALVTALQSQPAITSRQAEVVAADSIVVEGRRLRLWGLAAPAPGALCADDGGEPYACETAAREVLTEEIVRTREALEFLAGQIHRQYADTPSLTCEILGVDDDGVDLARCHALNPSCIPQQVECTDNRIDLAEELISLGLGAQRRALSSGAYDEAEYSACVSELGAWGVPDGAGVARRHEAIADCAD